MRKQSKQEICKVSKKQRLLATTQKLIQSSIIQECKQSFVGFALTLLSHYPLQSLPSPLWPAGINLGHVRVFSMSL